MRPGAAWNANQTFIMSGTWHGFDADRGTHTTRCKLERRIPPLKMLMASPRLQIACPGIGCGVQTVNMGASPRTDDPGDRDAPSRIAMSPCLGPSPAGPRDGCEGRTDHRNAIRHAMSPANRRTVAADQRAKVGVRADGGLGLGRGRLGRVLDAARLAPAGLLAQVLLGERALGEPEPVVEDVEQRVVHRERLLDERPDGALHACVHRGRVRAVHDLRVGEGVVLCDVDELDSVEVAVLVGGIGTSSFVADRRPVREVDYWGSMLFAYPNDIPSSPCSYFIFSSNGRAIVSAPMSNIPCTSSSAPWFLRLHKIQ